MVGGDCESGASGTAPRLPECTAAQDRGVLWLAIGTVALFPAAFLSRAFTFLPAMAVMLLLTGFAAVRELDQPGVRRGMSAAHEQGVQIAAVVFLGAGAVVAACAAVSLLRLARTGQFPS